MANLKQSDVQALYLAYKNLGQSINGSVSAAGQVTDFSNTAINTALSTFKTAVEAIGLSIS